VCLTNCSVGFVPGDVNDRPVAQNASPRDEGSDLKLSRADMDQTVHWSEFRGPTANGHAPNSEGAPIRWSEEEGVRWKTEIPLIGWSSPAIVGNQIWLTTSPKEGHDFYAVQVNADTGQIVYNERIFHVEDDQQESLNNEVNSFASPTPVVEEGRVYVHFGTYGTACIDTLTKEILWKRDDINIRHLRGPGASPVLFEDFLILNMDGLDHQFQIALDKNTGETKWTTSRSVVWNDFDKNGKIVREGDMRKSYTTPVLTEVNGEPLMISPGSFAFYGYDPRNGREVFKLRHGVYTPGMRPIIHNNIMYAFAGYESAFFLAARIDGTGDVTDTHEVWRIKGRHLSLIPSPTIVDDRLYLTSDKGTLFCLDPKTGEEIWTHRLGGSYTASAVYAGGNLYCFNTQGKTTIIKPGPVPEEIAENRLDDGCMATPAMIGNSLVIRTKTHLYRIDPPR